MNVEFSARLKEERLRLGLNQEAMAVAGDVGVSTYYNYDSGKRVPTVEFLAKIAVLGVDIHFIITGVRTYPDVPVLESTDERVLLDNYRKCDEKGRRMIEQVARMRADECKDSPENQHRALMDRERRAAISKQRREANKKPKAP